MVFECTGVWRQIRKEFRRLEGGFSSRRQPVKDDGRGGFGRAEHPIQHPTSNIEHRKTNDCELRINNKVTKGRGCGLVDIWDL
jgi:hypothetical protein